MAAAIASGQTDTVHVRRKAGRWHEGVPISPESKRVVEMQVRIAAGVHLNTTLSCLRLAPTLIEPVSR
jgi:hypothetical protein